MPLIARGPTSDGVAPILSHISNSSMASLGQETNQTIHPQTMYWYPIDMILYLFILWAMALCLHDFILPSRFVLGSRWKSLADYRRTMVAYLLSVLVTLIAFILQVAGSGLYHLQFTTTSINMIRTAGTLVTTLYLFELIYREKMRFAMICHHTLTIFAIAFTVILLDKTHDPSFIITGSLWLYQATTEQLTFIGLFGYRLEWEPKSLRRLLHFAAIQSLLVKMASIVACIIVWIKYQKDSTVSPSYNHAWDVIFWIAATGLMITQFWGSWVVWVMGTSLESRYERKRAERVEQAVNIQASPFVLKRNASSKVETPMESPLSTFVLYNTNNNTSTSRRDSFASCVEHLQVPALARDAK